MKTSWRRLEDVFRLHLQKTSWRCLEDVLIKTNMFALALRLQKSSSRRLQDVLVKTNIFVLDIHLEDVLKTFSRRLQDVLPRCLQDVFKTYYQVKVFLVTQFQDIFETYSKLFWDFFFFFLIGIHPMQGWTATTRHGVTRKEAQKASL